MPMTGGAVTIADDGSYTGTGLAAVLMDAHVIAAEALAQQVSPGCLDNPSVRGGIRRQAAALANAYGPAIVSYLLHNAQARVTTEVLARTPNVSPVPPGADVLPPSSPVDVPIV